MEPPDRPGGVEHLVREMVNGLEVRGYEIEVFHRGNSEPTWLTSQSGRFGKKLAGTLCGYWVGRNAQKHMSENVVAVISNGDVGFYPLRSAKTLQKIHFYHGTYRGQSEAIRPLISYLGYLYLKWWNSMTLERLSGHGKLVLCNSDQTRKEVKVFFGYQGFTVCTPMDMKNFVVRDSKECRKIIGLPEDEHIGLFVGSTSPTKNFALVRRLIDAMQDVQWALALRGEVPDDVKHKSRVRIFQNSSHRELPLLYGAADFTLCPSHYESFGYVVAEALACGTPVIACPGGASRLFLRQHPLDRLLISRPDAFDEFLAVAHEILRDPELYRMAVIEHARPRVKEWMAPENWWSRFFDVTGL